MLIHGLRKPTISPAVQLVVLFSCLAGDRRRNDPAHLPALGTCLLSGHLGGLTGTRSFCLVLLAHLAALCTLFTKSVDKEVQKETVVIGEKTSKCIAQKTLTLIKLHWVHGSSTYCTPIASKINKGEGTKQSNKLSKVKCSHEKGTVRLTKTSKSSFLPTRKLRCTSTGYDSRAPSSPTSA